MVRIVSWLLCIISTVFVVWGDDLLKQVANEDGSYLNRKVLYATALYGITGPLWLYIIKNRSLTQVAIMYSILMVLGVTALGVLKYGETPSYAHLLALGLAIAAAVLIEVG